MTLDDMKAYIALVTFIFGAMRIVVIAPMKDCISKIEATMLKMDEKMDASAERLTRVEESAKSAHKRLDEIVK